MPELPGVWLRTLVREADGSTDCVTSVTWVQGASLFADLRQPPGWEAMFGGACPADLAWPQLLALCGQKGFAGALLEDGGVFSWLRRIDLHPTAPVPDAGVLRWEGGVLVEEGVHEAYLERWEQAEGAPGDVLAAATLEDPDGGCAGVLVRAGSWFGYARDRSVPLAPSLGSLVEQVGGAVRRADAMALLDCEVSVGRVHAERWEILASTLPHRVGARLGPALSEDGDGLRIHDADPRGRARPRDWLLAQVEGPVRLLTADGPRG